MQLSSKVLVGLSLLAALPAAARAQPVAPEPAAPEPAAREPAPPVRRDLSIRLDLGGTEPGTSRQAFEGNVSWRGIPDYELQAGWTYSDQVYFSSNRGYATVYRFYADGLSYVKADASVRRYDYPLGGVTPNPDSSSYRWVPRGELELSHLFTRAWRGELQYQLFPASFFHDPGSWTVNHKLSGQVAFQPLPQVTLAARAAVLRDPDPNATIVSRTGTGTRVVHRTTALVGGSAAVELDRIGAKLEYLPNRDLDNSYDWSLLGTLDLRLTRRLDLRLQAVHDTYSDASNFRGRTAFIAMGALSYAVSDALRLRGGYRWVDVPDAPPAANPTALARRRDGTVVVGLELRPGL